MTKIVSLSAVLKCMGACEEAREWVRSTGNVRFRDTWNACDCEEWMWWLVLRVRDHLPRERVEEARVSCFTPAAHRRAIPADMMERAILAWAARGQS